MALVFGAALAAVEVNLKGVISANKLSETLDRVPELVWGKEAVGIMAEKDPAVEITPGIVTIKKPEKTSAYQLYRVVHGGKLSGWVVKAAGQGYADKIEILVGLDPEVDTITGIFVLDQKETPGLGNNIILPGWRNQFVQKKTETPLIVGNKDGDASNTIDALTGATISSRSVTEIVNRTIGDIKGRLTPETIRFVERQ